MRSRWITAMVAVACLAGAPGDARALEETVPPVGTEHEMSLAELRYCIFQGVRLKSANDTLDASAQFEVDRFNELVDDWNARCLSYRYVPSDLDAAETSAELKRIQLETEGAALVIGWRTDRAATVFHVTASALNLRAGPGPGEPVIGRLKRFKDLRVTGPQADGWLPIEVDGKTGYVSRDYVARGSGREPQRAYCGSVAGTTPANGEVLVREGSGGHVVRVENERAQDALVKLKDTDGRTRLAFYVVAGGVAEVGGVPDGEYRLMFATGDGFSRGCNRFIDNMRVQASATRGAFETTIEGGTPYYSMRSIKLRASVAGDAATNLIDLDTFDD